MISAGITTGTVATGGLAPPRALMVESKKVEGYLYGQESERGLEYPKLESGEIAL